MQQLKFSHNWNNKLNCNCFTTLRIENLNKYKVGNIFEVILKKEVLKKVMVIEVKSLYLHQLNEYISQLDTGYSTPETKEIFKKMFPKIDFSTTKLNFVLLKTIKA